MSYLLSISSFACFFFFFVVCPRSPPDHPYLPTGLSPEWWERPHGGEGGDGGGGEGGGGGGGAY